MPDQSCENESLLKVVKTPFAGRSYRTNRTLLAGDSGPSRRFPIRGDRLQAFSYRSLCRMLEI